MASLDPGRRDPLDDFEIRQITLMGRTKRVYVAGTGPAVIVMTEIPGISPYVARFARWVRDAGFTVYMPSLFGEDGVLPGNGKAMLTLARVCISREFRAFASNDTSPVVQWLRALAAQAHGECGGKGAGAIGMCFTGNFALSMMLEKAMLAPVMSQPSLPLNNPAGMAIDPADLAAVKARMEAEDLTVLGYRFDGDSFCRAERFAAFQNALGDRFIGKVLPDSAANPNAPLKTPHSVVTLHLIDEAGQPTVQARDDTRVFPAPADARLEGSRWRDHVAAGNVASVYFIADGRDVLDVAQPHRDVLPVAADRLFSRECGRSRLEHQRFRGAVHQGDHLCTLRAVAGLVRQGKFHLAARDIVELADQVEQDQLGGIQLGSRFTEIAHIRARTSAWADRRGQHGLFRSAGDDLEHRFDRADQLGDASGADHRNNGKKIGWRTKVALGAIDLAGALIH